MQCLSPRLVGFKPDGKSIAFSPKQFSKEYATFKIPCSKCRACRLENARQTAVRCVHEASLYENNSFVTLTYSEEHLKSDKLIYSDFQKFIKDLRNYRFEELLGKLYPNISHREGRREQWKLLTKETRNALYDTIRISVFCAGEYGDKGKRPHWHALIFNWQPNDLVHKYSTPRGDKVYSSAVLNSLWPMGFTELGSVTFESASYCARYATKKLYHGKDGTHPYEPISRRSAKNAIGKKWVQNNWRDCFETGYLVFKKGTEYIQCGIPRYYEKWLKKNKPDAWKKYVTEVKPKIIEKAIQKDETHSLEEKKANFLRRSQMGLHYTPQITQAEHKSIIMEQKAAQFAQYLKL
ncbi:MAG: replication initiator protein [Microvirus sp.]|nr:MAG: replication initiator protein [Microvirus sp.]